MKKYLAEMVGTMVLVLMGCGTAVSLACGTDTASVVGTACAFGLAVVAMAYTIGGISGCHINPAITLGVFLSGRMSGKDAIMYIIFQGIGAVLGAAILFAFTSVATGFAGTLTGANTCAGAGSQLAGFIVELAKYLKVHAPDVKIVVIGIIDAKDLPDNIIVHGEYALSELPGLIDRYRVNIGFISSIWPETFSYVTQELMMLDLPLACFDIGAPRDRIGHWEKGRIIPEITPEAAWSTIAELYRTCYQGELHA